ncbi:Uncharacterised protein [Vibrio cholerae]|uniref:Uncharacterized protein n=1 Tax=Vibrio cholerae TaxID=666 RepID=A0A655WJ28_VIBCL|nr:Uncharacterised protein [Vibrio cholerae]CSB17712.1 Uncharacterised protein [Vibrio cholerae]CSB91348.1 Uncharacterised protein [Vibrio cholerae]CSC13456.1 Uncharacterised protein [Vibrio cholerae]CSC59324.1 Uncharacterised protein [Vibrio cholerae]
MHVVDGIQCSDVLCCQPTHEVIQLAPYIVEVEHFVGDLRHFWTHLDFQFLIHTTVDYIQQRFSKVSASTEELHVFTNNHW